MSKFLNPCVRRSMGIISDSILQKTKPGRGGFPRPGKLFAFKSTSMCPESSRPLESDTMFARAGSSGCWTKEDNLS